MMLRKWNSNFAPFTMQCPERYRRNLLRSFADWTGTRLPCVHSLNSVCHGRVCSSSMMFSMSLVRATRRGSLAVSDMSKNGDHMESRWDLGPMIWRIQKRRRRYRRRLLKSAPFNKLLLNVNSEVLFRDCRSVVHSMHIEETHNKHAHINTTQLERKCCRNFILL